jgi:hypothetical protein
MLGLSQIAQRDAGGGSLASILLFITLIWSAMPRRSVDLSINR